MHFRIWRSAMAPSDYKEKNSNIDVQQQFVLYTTAKNILENLLAIWLFSAQTSSFWAIFGLPVWSL